VGSGVVVDAGKDIRVTRGPKSLMKSRCRRFRRRLLWDGHIKVGLCVDVRLEIKDSDHLSLFMSDHQSVGTNIILRCEYLLSDTSMTRRAWVCPDLSMAMVTHRKTCLSTPPEEALCF
jgi:hypothetical protein